jgi:ABC-2 type transport system ATP-binding protein
MPPDVIVETRKLTKIYRDFWGRQKKTALRALNIEVRRGEVFGLLGPNGSGKTTTIKLLLGLLFPTDGEGFVFGQPAADVRKNERIGYLPEESYLYRFLNAEETLDFYGRLFNLDPLIGLAQALINDPDLVILDEPTSGLDPLGARWMKDLIRELRALGKTVIMCSHRLEDVQDVCDRIAILNEGELQAYGEVEVLLQDTRRVEMRASGLELTPALRAELEEVLHRHGGKLDTIGHPTTTLEDYFLRIVEESKAHPGRRFLPGKEPAARPAGAGTDDKVTR